MKNKKEYNRLQRQKPDTIEVRWVKTKDDCHPDWWATWEAEATKPTSILCMNAIAKLGDELVLRGYDRASLRFSVRKIKQQAEIPPIAPSV